jgi:predicted DNA binding CopG/RHH family protein
MAYYVKNEAEYEKVDYNRSRVRQAARRLKKSRKKPTSVALDPAVIRELRKEAAARDIPYQVLMRMLIVQGLRKLKKAS